MKGNKIMFKLNDIKAGYLIKVRVKTDNSDEIVYMTVVPGCGGKSHEGELACCGGDKHQHYWPMRMFDENLVFESPGDVTTVLAVYGYTMNRFLLDSSPEKRALLWERKADEPKKMTVAEICKALGYDVEIVKEG
jgi:hypothetical protein